MKSEISDCIALPLKEFAVNELEDTNDRINLWQNADSLAESIIAKIEGQGFAISKN